MDDTHGGQLEGEGDAVETATDLGDRGGGGGIEHEARRRVPRSLDEQLDGFETSQTVGRVVISRKLERGHPPGDLAGVPERLAARGHDDEIGASRQELRGQGDDGVEDVLAVVEDEQDRPARELVDERGDPRPVALEGQLEGTTDRRRDAVTVRHAGQLHEPHPVRPAEARHLTMRDLDGQAGLARAAGAGEREQARPFEQPAQLSQFPMATDEARRQRGQVVRTRPRIGGATDEEPAVDGGGLGRGGDAVRLGEPVPEALEGSRRVPASPGCGQRDQQRPVHVLVEWPLHRQRLQQREGLVGQSVGHQGTSEVPHQPGSDRAQPVAVRRRPVLVEVLGQELARPQGERVANVLGRTGRGSPRGRGVEVVDVDGHAALATEDDDLVVENEVLGAHHPAGRMQRLMEVVRADRRVGLGPQLLDEDITVNPMARRERQELDDRLCLSQPPPWRRDGALASRSRCGAAQSS